MVKIISTKILPMLLVILMLCSTMSMVFAAPDPGNYTGADDLDVTTVENLGQQIISIISTVASIASVIVLIVLGIKYMMGSAEEKAEYKKTLLPYVIGAVLVFAAAAIASMIYGVANNITAPATGTGN